MIFDNITGYSGVLISSSPYNIGTMSGILAGLVSITAGCAVVQVWAAVLIGIIGGAVQFIMSRVREYILYIYLLDLSN